MLFIADSINLEIIPERLTIECSQISLAEVLSIITTRYQDAERLEATTKVKDSVIIWHSLIHDARVAKLVSSYIGLDIGVNSSYDSYRQLAVIDSVIVCKVNNDRNKNGVTFYILTIKENTSLRA